MSCFSLLVGLSVAITAYGAAKFYGYSLLQDNRLCNNGGPGRYADQACITRPLPDTSKGTEYRCDSRNVHPDQCRKAVVEMDEFTVAGLLSLVPTADDDLSVRRLVVQLTSRIDDFAKVGAQVDAFLRPRLWWYVETEPYHWSSSANTVISFGRVQHEFEPKLRILAATQFPPSQDICTSTPLLLMHRDFKHPGWYSMLVQYNSVHTDIPYAVSAVYVSSENSVHDSTSFITAEDCPTIVNKWECAFLAITNCTLPTAVTECTGVNCVVSSIEDTRKASALFDSASATGKNLHSAALQQPHDSADYLYYQSIVQRSKIPPVHNPTLLAAIADAANHKAPVMEYIKPYKPELAPFQSMMFADFDFYTFNLILRPSYFYRSRMAQTIDTFRKEYNFGTNERCVAAQIRRGDRVPGGNITAYCLDKVNRRNDMGCANVPFAAITLQDVVDSAAVLVEDNVRTLIVTTDDEAWLNEQREELEKTRPEWRILNLKGPTRAEHASHSEVPAPLVALRGSEEYKYMRYGAGTASGVLLHGSIELSRQCEAFVGHFGCGGTMLVYKSLCAQHNQREHVCPPAFDLRTIKELQFE